jgi:probable phosphoglycerate mutase
VRVLLIRHGQTPNNVTGALDTAVPGAGLTTLGQAQAAAVPEALEDQQIVAAYASPLTRTQLTAAPLATSRGLEVGIRGGLAEVPAGDFEMRSDLAAVHGYAQCLAAWMSGDLARVMPGGIDGYAFCGRFDGAIRAIAADHGDNDSVAVFTHGAAMRVYTAVAARLDPVVAVELSIANTGLGILAGNPESGWRLQRWNSDPLGGSALMDRSAHDVTGESAEEAALD